MAEATLEFLGEQLRRMLDAQGEMRGDLREMRGELRSTREELVAVRERGEPTARAIEATRQQFLAQLELARTDLLEPIEKGR